MGCRNLVKKRAVLGELEPNPTQPKRPKRSSDGCDMCKVPFCKEGSCWEVFHSGVADRTCTILRGTTGSDWSKHPLSFTRAKSGSASQRFIHHFQKNTCYDTTHTPNPSTSHNYSPIIHLVKTFFRQSRHPLAPPFLSASASRPSYTLLP